MRILGINALNHDASISLIDNGEVVFAAHSERYSGIKNDSELHAAIFADMYRYGKPDKVAYFERPWLKKYRQLKAGQYKEVFQLDNTPKKYLKRSLLNHFSNVTFYKPDASRKTSKEIYVIAQNKLK